MVRTLSRSLSSVLLASSILDFGTPNRSSAQLPPRLVWESSTSFSAVAGVREFKDGRLLIADATDLSIYLLSSSGRVIAQGTSVGSGPLEYRSLQALMPLAGDTTIAIDHVLRRRLFLSSNGRIARSDPLPTDIGGLVGERVTADSIGNLWVASDEISPVPSPRALLRWNRSTGAIERVGLLTDRLTVSFTRRTSGGPPVRVVRVVPWAPFDSWTSFGDGSFAIVRGSGYVAEFMEPDGRLGKSVKVPYVPVKVCESERKQYPGEILEKVVSTKAPFEEAEIVAGPQRELWSRRSMRCDSRESVYDVIDGKRGSVRRVSLGRRVYILAVTERSIIAVRIDDDGLNWLQKYSR